MIMRSIERSHLVCLFPSSLDTKIELHIGSNLSVIECDVWRGRFEMVPELDSWGRRFSYFGISWRPVHTVRQVKGIGMGQNPAFSCNPDFVRHLIYVSNCNTPAQPISQTVKICNAHSIISYYFISSHLHALIRQMGVVSLPYAFPLSQISHLDT